MRISGLLALLLTVSVTASPIVKRQEQGSGPDNSVSDSNNDSNNGNSSENANDNNNNINGDDVGDEENGDYRANYHGSQLCEVTSNGTDAAQAIHDAVEKCQNNATILFTPGANYTIGSPVRFQDLNDVVVRMWGNLVVGGSGPAPSGDEPWIFVSGHNVQWLGSEKFPQGWVYVNGGEGGGAAQQPAQQPAPSGSESAQPSGSGPARRRWWHWLRQEGGNQTPATQTVATQTSPAASTPAESPQAQSPTPASSPGPSPPAESPTSTTPAESPSPTPASTSPAEISGVGGEQPAPVDNGTATGDGEEPKPRLFSWYLTNSTVTKLKIVGAQGVANFIDSGNTQFTSVAVHSAGSDADGFHLSGQGVHLNDGVVFTGGNAVTVVGNASNITVQNLLMDGANGSMAVQGTEGCTVDGVKFEDMFVVNSRYASLVSGQGGNVSNLQFDGINVGNVTSIAHLDNGEGTMGINDVLFTDWRGSVEGNSTVEVSCGQGRCHNIQAEDINVLPAQGMLTIKCQGVDKQTSPHFGLTCEDGVIGGSGGGAEGGAGGGGGASSGGQPGPTDQPQASQPPSNSTAPAESQSAASQSASDSTGPSDSAAPNATDAAGGVGAGAQPTDQQQPSSDSATLSGTEASGGAPQPTGGAQPADGAQQSG